MLTADHVRMAFRLFFDREPESAEVIEHHLHYARTTAELRRMLLASAEYRIRNSSGSVAVGAVEIPRNWAVGGEAGVHFLARLESGFLERYLGGEKILDVGFRGYGNGANAILPHAIGVDLDYPGYDGITLPFEDGSIDSLFSSHMLEHVTNCRAVIRDWHRVLKIGGFIVCMVPHQFLYEKKQAPPSRWNADHKRFFTPAALLAEFEAALVPNSYRIRHLVDNDRDYTYAIGPERHPGGGYEIELVIEKIAKPDWELDA